VAGAVVDHRRPVLLDAYVRGHGEAIVVAAIEETALPVFHGEQIKLAGPDVLDAGKHEVVREGPVIDCVRVGFS